jgi:hypothetical protein
MNKLSRSELIELVQKVLDIEGTEQQLDERLYLIRCNVPDPGVLDLIYGTELSAEEIIDRALAYQPVLLGPSSLDSSDG